MKLHLPQASHPILCQIAKLSVPHENYNEKKLWTDSYWAKIFLWPFEGVNGEGRLALGFVFDDVAI